MTAKRFEYIIGEFWDNVSDESLSFTEIEKKINALNDENEQLKKSIECQNEMIKEQCMKIDWASECGVKWDKEFKNWRG